MCYVLHIFLSADVHVTNKYYLNTFLHQFKRVNSLKEFFLKIFLALMANSYESFDFQKTTSILNFVKMTIH